MYPANSEEMAELVHNMVSDEVTDTEDIPTQVPITLEELSELEGGDE